MISFSDLKLDSFVAEKTVVPSVNRASGTMSWVAEFTGSEIGNEGAAGTKEHFISQAKPALEDLRAIFQPLMKSLSNSGWDVDEPKMATGAWRFCVDKGRL